MVHRNFCRVSSALRTTPAVALGVADRIWTVADLIEAALSIAPEVQSAQPPGPAEEAAPEPVSRILTLAGDDLGRTIDLVRAQLRHSPPRAKLAEAIGASAEGITGPELARQLYGEGAQATRRVLLSIKRLVSYVEGTGVAEALFFTRTPEGYAVRYRPGPILRGFTVMGE